MSLGNYGRARLRSGLTTAGVAIGTALVVLLIALATGAEDNVRRSIFSIGDLRLVTASRQFLMQTDTVAPLIPLSSQ